MRRLFVLFLVFLIPLQFLDESFDDLVVPPADESGFRVVMPVTDSLPVENSNASGEAGDSSSSQGPHADLSDSVAVPGRLPSSASPLALVAAVREYVFPLRVFPILDPPRV